MTAPDLLTRCRDTEPQDQLHPDCKARGECHRAYHGPMPGCAGVCLREYPPAPTSQVGVEDEAELWRTTLGAEDGRLRAELEHSQADAEIWKSRCRRYEQHMADNVPSDLWPEFFEPHEPKQDAGWPLGADRGVRP